MRFVPICALNPLRLLVVIHFVLREFRSGENSIGEKSAPHATTHFQKTGVGGHMLEILANPDIIINL